MKRIYFADRNREIVISDEAYENIKRIIQIGRVCGTCAGFYSSVNPCIFLNTCLNCFFKREEYAWLKYVRELPNSGSDAHVFALIDPQGYIHTTQDNRDHVERSTYHTLTHWGFPVPETISRNGKDITLYPHNWTIYGRFTLDPVVVIQYADTYGNFHFVFAVYHDGTITELNKRKSDTQRLFRQAWGKIEATRDSSGEFHLGEFYSGKEEMSVRQIYDSHVYQVIAHILSASYEPGSTLWSERRNNG